jgi:hypothetical protein
MAFSSIEDRIQEPEFRIALLFIAFSEMLAPDY